jgi:hypothetical protein
MAALEAVSRAAPAPAAAQAPATEASVPEGGEAAVPAAAPAAAPRKLVAMRGDDRPGQKRAEVAPVGRDGRRDGKPGGRPGGRDDARGPRDGARFGRDDRGFGRDDRAPRGPRLGDAAFRAQRQALEAAQSSLKRLAEQAHGEVLTQIVDAWRTRNAEQLPAAQALGPRVPAAQRSAWGTALAKGAGDAGDALLRLEIAADVPTPAEQLSERRLLQLQLLTRRHEAAPAETWTQDVARVLGSAHDERTARRLQTALKALLKR